MNYMPSFDMVWEDLKAAAGADWTTYATLGQGRPNQFRWNSSEDVIELRTTAHEEGKAYRKLERSLFASAWDALTAKTKIMRLDLPRQKHSSAVVTLLAQLDYVSATGPQELTLMLRAVPSMAELDKAIDLWLAGDDHATEGTAPADADALDDALIARLSLRNCTEARVRQAMVRQFDRDSRLSRLIKRKRGYRCQVCGQNSFLTSGGEPYVETHHLDWLSDEGRDVEENILVVCAVCHRKFHHGEPPAVVNWTEKDLLVTLCGQVTRIPDFAARRSR